MATTMHKHRPKHKTGTSWAARGIAGGIAVFMVLALLLTLIVR